MECQAPFFGFAQNLGSPSQARRARRSRKIADQPANPSAELKFVQQLTHPARMHLDAVPGDRVHTLAPDPWVWVIPT